MKLIVVVFLLAVVLTDLTAADDDYLEVLTCGSIIKIGHQQTGGRLHSHSVNYGSGSHQQSVTGQRAADDPNSFWVVRPGYGVGCRQGQPIAPGTPIRLQHLATQRFLHSHRHPAPLSPHLQEVSCFGTDDGRASDQGDDWIFEALSSNQNLAISQKFRLKHVATDSYLASHDTQFGNPIPGQFEIFTRPQKQKDTIWRFAEGIYYPSNN